MIFIDSIFKHIFFLDIGKEDVYYYFNFINNIFFAPKK
jgi:hypothetical protein